jgi:hypothetical protein
MNDMLKIVSLNAYIQRNMGKLELSGKEVLCVALDRTCTFQDDEDEITLTDAQLDELVRQITTSTGR